MPRRASQAAPLFARTGETGEDPLTQAQARPPEFCDGPEAVRLEPPSRGAGVDPLPEADEPHAKRLQFLQQEDQLAQPALAPAQRPLTQVFPVNGEQISRVEVRPVSPEQQIVEVAAAASIEADNLAIR